MTRLTLAIAPIVPFCVLLTACGPRAATVVDDRDTYVETIADTICNEKQTCGEIGEEDSQYDNYDDCHSDAESFMRDLWPADECDQGRIAGDQAVRILEGKDYIKHVGPKIFVVDQKNIGDVPRENILPPEGFSPVFSVN